MNDNAIIFTAILVALLALGAYHIIKERRAAQAKARRTLADDLRDAIRDADRNRLEEEGRRELAEHMAAYWGCRMARLESELEVEQGPSVSPGVGRVVNITVSGQGGGGGGPTTFGKPLVVPTAPMPDGFTESLGDSFPEGAGQGRARHEAGY